VTEEEDEEEEGRGRKKMRSGIKWTLWK